jgi:hypothetical protein
METIERTFNVAGAGRLSVSNVSGTVDIQPGEDGVIQVTAVKHANGDADHTQIDIEQGPDGSVTVKTDYQQSIWHFTGHRPCDVDYTVRVPHNCAVQLRCVSSTGAVRGLAGEFNLSMVSGELALADLSGALKLNSVSGDISGERLAGPLKVDMVSGDVELRRSRLGPIEASTVSGNVTLETEAPLANGSQRFHSVSGQVRLIVPPQTRALVQGSSLSGHVQSDLPVTRNQHSGQHWNMELQGGGLEGNRPEIRFDSISGNLMIERGVGGSDASPGIQAAGMQAAPAELPVAGTQAAAEAKTIADAPAATPIANAEQTRQDILDRVARGELSVEEAVKLLRG